MKCRFPVAQVNGITIAVLLVETNNQHLGMILHPAPENELQDPIRKMYYIAWPFRTDRMYLNCRLALLGGDLYDLRFRGKPVNATWRDIYIHASPRTSDRMDPHHFVLRLYPDRNPAPFRIPRRLVQKMISLKLLPDSGTASSDPNAFMNMWVDFTNTYKNERVHVQFGLCGVTFVNGLPCHWAYAESSDLSNWTARWSKVAHSCETDHVDDWPDGLRTFGDSRRRMDLTFVKCTHSPALSRVLGIKLSGSVYDALQREGGIVIAEPAEPVVRLGTPLTAGTPKATQALLLPTIGHAVPSPTTEQASLAQVPNEPVRADPAPAYVIRNKLLLYEVAVVSFVVSVVVSATIIFLSDRAVFLADSL